MKIKDRIALLEQTLKDKNTTYFTLLNKNNEIKDLLENAQAEIEKLRSTIHQVLFVIEHEDLTKQDVWKEIKNSLVDGLSADMDPLISKGTEENTNQ